MEPDLTFSTPLRVRYAETDAQGIVHHSSYIIWFELGRVEWLRSKGISYRDLEASGLVIVLSGLEARYHSPARFDDELLVTTSLAQLRSRQVVFGYRITRQGDGALLVTGRTDHILLDTATGRPARWPPELNLRPTP